jgi:GR25 family glycosyltransferase involved in LPS biosynthesis
MMVEAQAACESARAGGMLLLVVVSILLLAAALSTLFPKRGGDTFVSSHDARTMEALTDPAPGMDVQARLINLDRNAERLRSFRAQWTASDFASTSGPILKRTPAVDGSAIDIHSIVSPIAMRQILANERTGIRRRHHELTRGAVGCFLSHLEIYCELLRSNHEYYIVFEDDAVFLDRLSTWTRMKELCKPQVSPPDWHLIMFGTVFHSPTFVTGHFEKVNRMFGTHAYAINRAGARKVLDWMSKRKMERQIDSEFFMINGLNVYRTQRQLVVQAGTETDVQNGFLMPTSHEDPFDLEMVDVVGLYEDEERKGKKTWMPPENCSNLFTNANHQPSAAS